LGLSKKFWVDTFLTSIYVINRLPTSVLNNSSPFEKLFHRSLDYSFLKVFGCKCFPLLRPYTSHKLDFRSKPCIFLGYSYKGYRHFDLLSKKVYLSRHVVFDEASFSCKGDNQFITFCHRYCCSWCLSSWFISFCHFTYCYTHLSFCTSCSDTNLTLSPHYHPCSPPSITSAEIPTSPSLSLLIPTTTTTEPPSSPDPHSPAKPPSPATFSPINSALDSPPRFLFSVYLGFALSIFNKFWLLAYQKKKKKVLRSFYQYAWSWIATQNCMFCMLSLTDQSTWNVFWKQRMLYF
jgi:hypothetical protein